MSNSILFTPKKLGNLTVPNRFIRSATWEALADKDGRPPKELLNMIEELALNKVGLIIPGAVYVTKRGQGMKGESGMTTIEHARKWKPCIEKVHQHGSKLIFQLIHNGLDANPAVNCGYPASGPTSFNSNQHELTMQLIFFFSHLSYHQHSTIELINGVVQMKIGSGLSKKLSQKFEKEFHKISQFQSRSMVTITWMVEWIQIFVRSMLTC